MSQVFKKLFWTEHSKIKMKQYGLSKQKLLGILYRPERKEQGIVSGTTAVMKTNKVYPKNKNVLLAKNKWQRKASGEIWLMYKDVALRQGSEQTRKIISAWRYPGVSKSGEEIPPGHGISDENY